MLRWAISKAGSIVPFLDELGQRFQPAFDVRPAALDLALFGPLHPVGRMSVRKQELVARHAFRRHHRADTGHHVAELPGRLATFRFERSQHDRLPSLHMRHLPRLMLKGRTIRSPFLSLCSGKPTSTASLEAIDREIVANVEAAVAAADRGESFETKRTIGLKIGLRSFGA